MNVSFYFQDGSFKNPALMAIDPLTQYAGIPVGEKAYAEYLKYKADQLESVLTAAACVSLDYVQDNLESPRDWPLFNPEYAQFENYVATIALPDYAYEGSATLFAVPFYAMIQAMQQPELDGGSVEVYPVRYDGGWDSPVTVSKAALAIGLAQQLSSSRAAAFTFGWLIKQAKDCDFSLTDLIQAADFEGIELLKSNMPRLSCIPGTATIADALAVLIDKPDKTVRQSGVRVAIDEYSYDNIMSSALMEVAEDISTTIVNVVKTTVFITGVTLGAMAKGLIMGVATLFEQFNSMLKTDYTLPKKYGERGADFPLRILTVPIADIPSLLNPSSSFTGVRRLNGQGLLDSYTNSLRCYSSAQRYGDEITNGAGWAESYKITASSRMLPKFANADGTPNPLCPWLSSGRVEQLIATMEGQNSVYIPFPAGFVVITKVDQDLQLAYYPGAHFCQDDAGNVDYDLYWADRETLRFGGATFSADTTPGWIDFVSAPTAENNFGAAKYLYQCATHTLPANSTVIEIPAWKIGRNLLCPSFMHPVETTVPFAYGDGEDRYRSQVFVDAFVNSKNWLLDENDPSAGFARITTAMANEYPTGYSHINVALERDLFFLASVIEQWALLSKYTRMNTLAWYDVEYEVTLDTSSPTAPGEYITNTHRDNLIALEDGWTVTDPWVREEVESYGSVLAPGALPATDLHVQQRSERVSEWKVTIISAIAAAAAIGATIGNIAVKSISKKRRIQLLADQSAALRHLGDEADKNEKKKLIKKYKSATWKLSLFDKILGVGKKKESSSMNGVAALFGTEGDVISGGGDSNTETTVLSNSQVNADGTSLDSILLAIGVSPTFPD